MATIVLQAVGTYIGGPVGGAVGAAIGGYIDQEYLFPAIFPKPDVQGNRVDSISLSYASEGAPISRGFGERVRAEGIVIWMSELREEDITPEADKGGGGGNGTKVLTYRADLAIAFAETSLLPGGKIAEVDRIHMDGNIAWERNPGISISSTVLTNTATTITRDHTGPQPAQKITSPPGGPNLTQFNSGLDATISGWSNGANNGTFRILQTSINAAGTSNLILDNGAAVNEAAGPTVSVSQTPPSFNAAFADAFTIYKGDQVVADPTIVASEGAANVPNYTRLAYFVVSNLDFAAGGGRPPQSFTIEYQPVPETTGSVADTIKALCESAGLREGTDFDVSGVTGTLKGTIQRGPTSAAQTIEQLMVAFDVQYQDRNGVLFFYDHDQVDVVSVNTRDLAAHEYGSDDAFRDVMVDDDRFRDIPSQVAINYVDEDNELQNGSQASPTIDVSLTSVLRARLDITMGADEAQCIARRLLYQLHGQAQQFRWSLPPSYLKYIENDVLLIPTPEGNIKRMMVNTVDDGNNGLRKYGGIDDQLSTVTFPVADCIVEDPDVEGQTIYVPPDLALFVMDLPPLIDIHKDSPGFYWVSGPFSPSEEFPGATLFESADDGATFNVIDTVTSRPTIGAATTALGNVTDPHLFDELRTVTVEMYSGSLVSVTRAELLRGKNRAYLGGEVIGFQTATLVSENVYQLSGLLRGLSETLQFTGTHVIGDAFVHLNSPGISQAYRPATLSGSTRDYKSVARDGVLANFDTQVNNLTLQINTLRRWAPAGLRAIRDTATDNIAITWQYRTRVPYFALSGAFLSEDKPNNTFQVDIFSAGFGTLLRTTIVTGSKSFTYTAAQQTADGLSLTATTVSVDVYETSQVGLSRVERLAIPVELI